MHCPRTVVLAGGRPHGSSFIGLPAAERLRCARPPSGEPAATGAAPVLSDGSAPGAALVLSAAFAVGGGAEAFDAGADITDTTDSVDAAGTVTTGFGRLDAELPGGGWPCRALTELLLPPAGASELRLLAPALREALHAGRTVMLFDPPAGLTAHSLARLGLDAEHLLVIESRSRLPADAGSLWALEQALKSGHVGTIVAWLPPRLAAERLRRLQVAAQRHDGPAFVLREAAAAACPTSAPLRLALHPHGDDGLTLRLLKRRPPASAGLLRLTLPPLPAVTSVPPPVTIMATAKDPVTAAQGAAPPQASLFGPARPATLAAAGERGAARPADRPLRPAVFVDLAA